jgi:hypothetical protein
MEPEIGGHMSNDQEQVREFAKHFSGLVTQELAPDEVDFVAPWVDGYLDSGASLEQILEGKSSQDAFMGFGSVELATALIAPIVVEMVKVLLPYILEHSTKKKSEGHLTQHSDLQVVLKKEKDKILFSVKAKGKNKKVTQATIDKIFESLLKVMEE